VTCYIYKSKTGGFLLSKEQTEKPDDYSNVWVFEAIDGDDASLKFHRFTWIFNHHESEIEAVRALHGEETSTLLPDYDWVENAVKNGNEFDAVIALLTIKSIPIREAQDEIHKVWKRLFE
jgi:hypothetical protein